MNLTSVKFILLGLMVTATFFCGLIPIKLLKFLRKSAASAATSTKQRNVSLVLCLLTCFSGGVFLATCFLHLFPELKEHLNMMEEEYEFSISYPVAELLSCCGFFLLFFLEELFLLLVPTMGHSHGPPNANIMNDEPLMDRHEQHDTARSCEENHPTNGTPICDGNIPEGKISKTSCNSKIQEDDSSPKQGLLCSSASTTSSTQSTTANNCNGASHRQCRRSRHAGVNLAEPEACETNCETVKEDPPILMKSMPHAHIHGVRSITFVAAISFHSVIEGLALGVQDDATELSALFISLMVHKMIVAFSVGLQLGRTHAHALGWVCISLLLLSLMSPVGGLIGMFVQNAQIDSKLKDIIILVMQGLAVGTFIYVTFFEVLLHERDNEHPNLLKLVFMIAGFALIGSLRLLDNHSHEGAVSLGHSHQ